MRLEQPRLKIKRAEHHIKDMRERILRLHDTDTARIEIDPATGGEVLTHEFMDTTAFDDLALMLGDAIHNLNCALDYTWLETIGRLVPSAVNDRAKFPVRQSIKEVKGWLVDTGVDAISPRLFNFMLDEIKPCEGGDSAIWPVHVLDIKDKHRLLIPVLSRGHIEGIKILDQYGETWPGFGTSEQLQRPPYVIGPYERGLHVKEKGKLTATILVENVGSPYCLFIPNTIGDYAYFLSCVVEAFECFLKLELG